MQLGLLLSTLRKYDMAREYLSKFTRIDGNGDSSVGDICYTELVAKEASYCLERKRSDQAVQLYLKAGILTLCE